MLIICSTNGIFQSKVHAASTQGSRIHVSTVLRGVLHTSVWVGHREESGVNVLVSK